MAWWRTMTWSRAAALAGCWVVAAVATALGILWLNPRGAAATALSEGAAAVVLLGAPVAAALVHRSIKPASLALGGYAAIAVAVLSVVLLNATRRGDHDRRYQEQRRSGESEPPTPVPNSSTP